MRTFKEVPIGEIFLAGSEEDGESAEVARFRKISKTEAVIRSPKWNKSESSQADKFMGFEDSSSRSSFEPCHPAFETFQE